jgi:hypothetical protein
LKCGIFEVGVGWLFLEIEAGKKTRSTRIRAVVWASLTLVRRASVALGVASLTLLHANLELLSFAPRVLAAARATPKQSLEKSAVITACVVG